MSIQLQPPVSLVKTEPLTVIKNEPPEEALEQEISTDIKDIDIVYHSLSADLIKSETVFQDIFENKHFESVQTQTLVVKAENSPFIKTENITQRNKSEDTSDGNVSRGTGQGVVEVQASHVHSNALSKLEAEEKDKEKIKVIKAPMIHIKSHEYTSLAEDKHVCNHCQHAYKALNSLKVHIRNEHREVTTMYQCPYCTYKSKWKDYIIRKHIILKHKDTKDIQWFQCNLCEMKFKLKYHLTQHMKVHLKHKKMKDELDLREKSLKVHIRNKHREVTTMYQCPYCTCKSKWKDYIIRKHIILKHKDTKDIQWFQCNLCEMKFKLKYHLTQHMKVHLKHKQMKNELDLREKRAHLKPEEIQYLYCYHCSHKSKRKSDLKIHIFRHHFKNVKQRKRHNCEKCDYKTYTSTQLKRHKLNHLKPEDIPYFHCYHCSHKSKHKQALKKHIFKHFRNEDVPFHCYICDFITQKRESIIEHIKKHSKVQIKFEIYKGS